jgi:hypothetical protein
MSDFISSGWSLYIMGSPIDRVCLCLVLLLSPASAR